MMLEQLYEWGIKLPRTLRCDKCIAFWTCLAYLYYIQPNQYDLIVAAISGVLTIFLAKRI